ncbi:MAG: diguanylate cyclase [Pseudomonadota bacterium]|nr:diguanylate cyclase [Pseudomonadota bacterium]
MRATVLVVDDDEADANALASALRAEGYDVAVVVSGADAVALARSRRFDLAVSDLRLNGEMDGVDTLVALKEIDDAMGVIIATGYSSIDSAITCLKRGAWDYVQKPIRLDELKLQLERALEHRQLQTAVELYEASHSLLTSLSSEDLRVHVLEMARRVLRSPTAVLALHPANGEGGSELQAQGDDAAEAVHVARRLYVDAPAQGTPGVSGQPWSGRLADTAAADLPAAQGFDRVIAYPLVVRDRSLGLLVVLRHATAPAFTVMEEQRGAIFAVQAALALDNARIYAALEHIAIVDELTGLHSRRYLFDIVRRSRPEETVAGTSFLMIDVDHFKHVNDRHGHAVGDRVLRRVADLLLTATRQNDIVARVGGEEFAVLLPHTDEETATDVAERVRAAVALHTHDPQVTVSIGVASVPGAMFQHGEDPIERAANLMERADGALYRAKRAGRNRVCVWRARKREPAGVS